MHKNVLYYTISNEISVKSKINNFRIFYDNKKLKYLFKKV